MTDLRVLTRILSTSRRVAYVPGFRQRYVTDLDWEERALNRLPRRVRQMKHWIAFLARYGFDVREGRILEVATGPGFDTRLLAALTAGALSTIDIHPRFSIGAREYPGYGRLHARLDAHVDGDLRFPPLTDATRYRFLQMDARALAFPDDSFDLVFCKSTLKMIPSPEQAMAECLRVLRPDGLLLVIDEPFTSVFGLCRGGVIDVPWAHVYLTEEEFKEVLPSEERARSKALENWRSVSRLTRERLVEATQGGAVLLSERYGYDDLPASFVEEVLRIVPELESVGPERLRIVEGELLFRKL